MIAFVDLKKQHEALKDEIRAKMDEVIESGAFIQGKYVKQFEEEFCKLHRADYGAGCSSGTTGLFLALHALGVGPGDEVITVANTFIATAEAISHVGATPVFVDVDPQTYNMDPVLLEKAIGPRTKAIIAVHLYGNPCDMGAILNIANKHGLFVIEDCAQSHLAAYNGQFTGTFGDAASFSFFPGKNLGAFGDAGLVISRTSELNEKIYKYLNHGRIDKYKHDLVGYNFRMDGLQGAVLSVKLKYLQKWTEIRRRNARIYDEILKAKGFKVIEVSPGSESSYHLYVVEVGNRDEVVQHLGGKGIQTGVHYPIPLHMQPAYEFLKVPAGSLPVTEKAAGRILSLPMCGELQPEQVHSVCDALLQVARP